MRQLDAKIKINLWFLIFITKITVWFLITKDNIKVLYSDKSDLIYSVIDFVCRMPYAIFLVSHCIYDHGNKFQQVLNFPRNCAYLIIIHVRHGKEKFLLLDAIRSDLQHRQAKETYALRTTLSQSTHINKNQPPPSPALFLVHKVNKSTPIRFPWMDL